MGLFTQHLRTPTEVHRDPGRSCRFPKTKAQKIPEYHFCHMLLTPSLNGSSNKEFVAIFNLLQIDDLKTDQGGGKNTTYQGLYKFTEALSYLEDRIVCEVDLITSSE